MIKPTAEMHLDASVYFRPFDDTTFFRGYVSVKDTQGRIWWSDVGVRNPVSVITSSDGETIVESANTFYRILLCEKHSEEMKKGENLRYLPPAGRSQARARPQRVNHHWLRLWSETENHGKSNLLD
jgi:hypothetical protein